MIESRFSFSLGTLADPAKHTGPLEVGAFSSQNLVHSLTAMIRIRRVEEKIAEMLETEKVSCPCHLAIGQEAIAVGVSNGLRKTDRVFGTHRSHAHYLAMGGSIRSLFSEVLGKKSGCAGGMGGSMHLCDEANGFIGSVPIVAGTISLAVGAGLAAKKDRQRDWDVGVCYFGDGAVEEGTFHESLNFASTFKIPVIFVCENNLFASALHIEERQPANCCARFAAAHGIEHRVVDGNDVASVQSATAELLKNARQGVGPGFLEAVTYRWRGHVGPSENIDVGLRRSDELYRWRARDPIRRLSDGLCELGMMTPERFEEIDQRVSAEISQAWNESDAAPFPDESALIDYVYQRGPQE